MFLNRILLKSKASIHNCVEPARQTIPATPAETAEAALSVQIGFCEFPLFLL